MLKGKIILAVVPARSGSKGIPGKNMRRVGGVSLIGHAGMCLQELKWIDAKIISTDSPAYVKEAKRYGLAVPFMRPAALSSDTSGAVETIAHAINEAERCYAKRFDIVLIIEPTSPLRQPRDIEAAVRLLVSSGADSVVTVSKLPLKFYPDKLLKTGGKKLCYYNRRGSSVVNRQVLEGESLCWRNGVCYALTRECIMEKKKIITDRSLPLLITREVVNIDDPVELLCADFLSKKARAK